MTNFVTCPICNFDKNEAVSSTNQTFTKNCKNCQTKFKYKLIITKIEGY